MKTKLTYLKLCHLHYGMLVMCFLALFNDALAQTKSISGKINDENGVALPGVNVLVKGTTIGTTSNVEGIYNLIVPEANTNGTLVFSYIGYTSQEVPINNQQEINISLVPDIKALGEIVVTGYGIEKKADLTGAIAVVNTREIKDIPSGNPMQALQGRATGLYIEADGRPGGANRQILIRGVNTLGNTSPLYIIDGVPTKRPEVFQSLNPNSIESIQILKDASASSIYGSRASNGVIIVTTKEGKAIGGENISLQLNSSISLATEKPQRVKMLNTIERGEALWRASVNDRTDPIVHQAIYLYDWNNDFSNPVLNSVTPQPFVGGDPLTPVGDTDWQDAAYRMGVITQHELNLGAGTDKSSLLVNLGYHYNQGMMVYTDYKRYTARVNAYTNFFNGRLKIGENLELAKSTETPSQTDLGNSSTHNLATVLAPTIPVKRTDGTYAGPVGAGYSDRNNPVNMQYINRWDKNHEFLVFGNVYAELQLIKNLVFRTSLGADYSSTLSKNIDIAFQEGFLGRTVNSLTNQQGHRLSLTWSNTANYQLELGQHRINLLAGMEAIKDDYEVFGAFREGFADQGEDFFYLDAGSGRSTNFGRATGNRLLSQFGKINYAFGDKYLASVTLRRDGSSRFGTENQYGLFPAATIGWRINSEGFFQNIPVVSNLKLRAGVGRVGNQEIGDIARFGLYQVRYGDILGLYTNIGTAYDLLGADGGALPSGFVSIQAENPNLKWESTEELNLGIDFGFLDEKITGSFDYFTRKTKDILIQPPIAGIIGEGKLKWVNGASKNNRGWELLLGYRNTTGEGGLSYNITGNISRFNDEITFLPAAVVRAYPGNIEKTILGRSQTSLFGYITDGLFQTQEEVNAHATQPGKGVGRIRYKDLNNDGKIDPLDQDWLGTTLPDFEYGVRANVSYKNFDFSMFWHGVQGKSAQDPWKDRTDFTYGSGVNYGQRTKDAWTPQNTSATIPALSLVNANLENRTSNYFIVNASYLKLRNVQLGYGFPKSIIEPLKMEELRVFVMGENLFWFKDKKGVNQFTGPDPERAGVGAGTGAYPRPTTVTFGLNLRF